MGLKKRIIEQLHSDNYSNAELNKIAENTTVLIFITNILLIIFFCIFLALLILSLWQFLFNTSLLIQWEILGIFVSVLLGIISVLLGFLSVLITQVKDIEETIDSSNEKK